MIKTKTSWERNSSLEVESGGNYQLVVTNSENGCTALSSAQVNEDYASPNANAGAGGELNCTVSTITLDGSASSQGSNFSYEWQNTNGTAVGDEINLDVSSADTYTLIVTNTVNACTSSSQVEVTSSNDFPIAIANSDGIINCLNNSVIISAEGSSSGQAFQYEWFDPNGSSLGNNSDLDVTNPGTYTLLVSDNSNGCTASTDVVVTENTEVPALSIAQPDQLTCSAGTINLSSTVGGVTNPSYEWFNPNGDLVGEQALLTVSQAGVYNLLVTNPENGCTASSSVEVAANTDTPLADAGSSATLTCTVNQLILNGDASSTGNSFSYLWTTINGHIVGDATSLNPSVDAPVLILWSLPILKMVVLPVLK